MAWLLADTSEGWWEGLASLDRASLGLDGGGGRGGKGGQVEFSRQKRGCSSPILMSLAGGADGASPVMEQGSAGCIKGQSRSIA